MSGFGEGNARYCEELSALAEVFCCSSFSEVCTKFGHVNRTVAEEIAEF